MALLSTNVFPRQMKVINMDWLKDFRIECWSVLLVSTVGEYLNLAREVHADRGGLQGQRDVLRTTTSKRIRDRMISDIRQGAVLPPVVIGIVVDSDTFAKCPIEGAKQFEDIVPPTRAGLAIIDGMQRTASLIEAVIQDSTILDRSIRVELWVARSVRALIYRMLVLNTGQVPWTLSRQLAVVYAPLIKEVQYNVSDIDKIYSPDKPGRRVAAAQYAADDIIELYLAFSLRKTSLDTKEALSEEFSRLDFVENLSDIEFQDQFYMALSLMAKVDKAFSAYEGPGQDRFAKGRNIFDSQPARIGLTVAIAQYVLGRPGQDRVTDERKKRIHKVTEEANKFVLSLGGMTAKNLGDFLRLEVLGEILDKKVGQVGRYERVVFFEAFRVLVEDQFQVPNMEPCWRAN